MNAIASPGRERLAGFLLNMKHRSVTPEPLFDGRESRFTEVLKSSYKDHNSGSYSIHESDFDFAEMASTSEIVDLEDRDLVPDALFVAMGQMKRCTLQPSDRVGCYKTREIGYVGFCCKHCNGQPGFGRYYPNSVRSLAQTTTSQTILKHIGTKCKHCPPHVREAILEMQRIHQVNEGLSTERPRYGSRKVFFDRIYQRIHKDGDFPTLANDISDEPARVTCEPNKRKVSLDFDRPEPKKLKYEYV